MTTTAWGTEADSLRSRWKWFVAVGAVMAICGLLILGNLVSATLVTTIFVGFLLVAAGVADIVAAFGSGRTVSSRLLHGLLGILYIVVGLNIVADPLRGAITLTVVIAALLVAEGVIRLVEAFAYRPPHWGMLVVVAAANIVLGLWLWTGIPVSGLAIGLFLGIEVLMAGVMWIALGWMSRPGAADRTTPTPATGTQA